MATSSNKAAIILNLFLMLSAFLFISVSGSRVQKAHGFLGMPPLPAVIGPQCDSVYAVKSGDTCFEVAKMFNLSTASFDAINPNLNCKKLFVGQWLCVKATPGN